MEPGDLKRLLHEFRCNPPAGAQAVSWFERDAGTKLPEDYVKFLDWTNGGEGYIGSHSYVILWRVGELKEMNEAYQAAIYAPGLFLFGSNRGGEAFAFDMRPERSGVVAVPFLGMDVSLARPIASSFDGFLQAIYQL